MPVGLTVTIHAFFAENRRYDGPHAIHTEVIMTDYRGFASMPSPLLWIMTALFVIPGMVDLTGILHDPPEDVMLNVAELLTGLFLLYCAVQAWRGRRSDIASTRTTIIGYACFGLFGLCFLVKVGTAAARLYA